VLNCWEMEGTVIKSTGSWYLVRDASGAIHECRIKGKIRLRGLDTTNPVAVGDRVTITTAEGAALITDIQPRENYILRKSVKKSKQGHMIAANIDQAVLVVTVAWPRTSMGFIDRFLMSAEGFRVPQILLFNKQDMLKKKDIIKQEEFISIYSDIGIKCLKITAETGEGLDEVRKVLEGKTNLIAGHSGVGKSTLLNQFDSRIGQKVSAVSDFSKKGAHTTTFAEMFTLWENTFLIDTPGIKELGIIETEEYEIADYFPEMRSLRENCKYNNCLHDHEPGCAIKEAVTNGRVSELRYGSYLSILYNEDNRR